LVWCIRVVSLFLNDKIRLAVLILRVIHSSWVSCRWVLSVWHIRKHSGGAKVIKLIGVLADVAQDSLSTFVLPGPLGDIISWITLLQTL
jgi:hypothetical protein